MDEVRLLESLARFSRRLRWKRVAESTVRVARASSVACLLLTLALKAWGLEMPQLAWGCLPLVVLPGTAALVVGARRIPPATVAAALDRAHGLQERLSTAVEWIVGRRPQTLMSRAQLQDALQSADGLVGVQVFPVRMPRAWWLPLVMAPALVGLCALPPWRFFTAPSEPLDVASVRAEARRLEGSAQELSASRKASLLSPAERQRLARQLQALARGLTSDRTTRRQALADLASSRQALQKALRDLRERRASQGAPSASPSPGPGAAGQATAGGRTSERLRSLAERARSQKPGSDTRSLAEEMARMARERPSAESARRALEDARRALEQGRSQEAASRLEEEARSAAACEQESASDQQAMEQGLEQVEQASATLAGRGRDGARPEGAPRGTAQGGGEELFPGGGRPGETVEGQGKVAPDFGVGTTLHEDPAGKAATSRSTFVKRQSQEQIRWTEAWRKLHQARRTAVDRGTTRVRGQSPGGGPTVATRENVRGEGRAGDRSLLDAIGVYDDSRRRAEEAVARSSIPQEYRDLVRNYFQDIDPRERGR